MPCREGGKKQNDSQEQNLRGVSEASVLGARRVPTSECAHSMRAMEAERSTHTGREGEEALSAPSH